MGISRVRQTVFATALGMVAVVLAAPAQAAIEEIRVTTRKLEEDLQNVPIAIDAITAEEINRKGIVNLDDLLQQSSSLILDRGFAPADQRIVVRGLSPTRGRQNVAVLQDGIDISSEAVNTGGGSLLINPRLFDLERVEIVKGPQNALYGRSAFAGAINYVTRKPGDEFEARVGLEFGDYGHQQLSAAVSGPLLEGLSAGITGMAWSDDGFYDNAVTGNRMGGTEGTSVAGTVVFRPADALSFTFRLENLDDEFGVSPFITMPTNYDFPVPQAAIDSGVTTLTSVAGVNGDAISVADRAPAMSERSQSCFDPTDPATCQDYAGTTRDITRGTLTIDWDVGFAAFTSLTHVASAKTKVREGADDTSASNAPTAAETYYDRDTDLFSQELRLSSNAEGAIKWVVGAQYWAEDVSVIDGSYTCLNYTGFPAFANGFAPCGPAMALVGVDPGSPLNPNLWERDTTHWSLYGLVEWQFLEQWKIAFEGRQTWEDVDVGGPTFDRGLFDPSGTLCLFFGCTLGPQQGPGTTNGVTTPPGFGTGSEDDDFFAPKVTLTWTPNDDVMLYFSWAEAYKPKGISLITGGAGAFYDTTCGQPGPNQDCTDPVASFRFDQERLDNYELGFKTDWADNRVQLNGAVFFEDFKNKQVSTQIVDPQTGLLRPRVVNAGKAEIWGFEANVLWLPIDNLSLSLGYTFLDSEYTDYTQFTTSPAAPSYVGNCTPATQAGSAGCLVDYSGNELEGAPENSLVGNARWQSTLVGSTDWFVEGDFEFQDDRFAGADNTLVFPSYWQFNFRAGITGDKLDLTVYLDNAFDDDTTRTGVTAGDIPVFFLTNLFLNRGRLYATDPRTFGVRMTYRFGG